MGVSRTMRHLRKSINTTKSMGTIVKRFTAKLISAVVVTCIASATAASAATLYATNQNSSNLLVAVDTLAGTPTMIGSIGFNVSALAANSSGELFGLTFSELISIDTVTGAGTNAG